MNQHMCIVCVNQRTCQYKSESIKFATMIQRSKAAFQLALKCNFFKAIEVKHIHK